VIDNGSLGAPKFMRCIARAGDPGQLSVSLGKLESLGEAWFGSRHVHSYRLGENTGLYLTEMLKWPDGQSALLTVSAGPTEGTLGLDLMLVGSRGTLYHEA